jgi:hypothetical protein
MLQHHFDGSADSGFVVHHQNPPYRLSRVDFFELQGHGNYPAHLPWTPALVINKLSTGCFSTFFLKVRFPILNHITAQTGILKVETEVRKRNREIRKTPEKGFEF